MQGTRRVAALVMGAFLGTLLGAATAQEQHKEKFAEAQKQNKETLRHYSWKSRTELKLKGESKNVKLEQVRYDVDGKLQKTTIGAPPQEQPEQQSSRRGAARSRPDERKDHREEEE